MSDSSAGPPQALPFMPPPPAAADHPRHTAQPPLGGTGLSPPRGLTQTLASHRPGEEQQDPGDQHS